MYQKQIDGAAMGSPLGRIFPNLFLVYHESIWLDKCLLKFKPKYFCWYVDNIFLRLEKKDHVQKFLKYVNSRRENNTFTFEEEHINKIVFLDISVTKVENELQTYFERKNLVMHTKFLATIYHLKTKMVCYTLGYTKLVISAQITLFLLLFKLSLKIVHLKPYL